MEGAGFETGFSVPNARALPLLQSYAVYAGHVYLFFSNFPPCTALLGPARLFFWTKIPPCTFIRDCISTMVCLFIFPNFPPCTALLGPARLFFWAKIPPCTFIWACTFIRKPRVCIKQPFPEKFCPTVKCVKSECDPLYNEGKNHLAQTLLSNQPTIKRNSLHESHSNLSMILTYLCNEV